MWFLAFVSAGLVGQILLLAAAGVWFRSRWSGYTITVLSACELLLAARLLLSDLWWLGLVLIPLPLVELGRLRGMGRSGLVTVAR